MGFDSFPSHENHHVNRSRLLGSRHNRYSRIRQGVRLRRQRAKVGTHHFDRSSRYAKTILTAARTAGKVDATYRPAADTRCICVSSTIYRGMGWDRQQD